jgi:dihydroneopterin aldolase
MSYQIDITGISVKGFHGVLPAEKRSGQKFVVDLALKVNGNIKQDEIKSVVDYSKVIDLVNEEVSGKSRNLIEKLADQIATRILREFKLVTEAKVTVHKPWAPITITFKDISVTVTKKR